MTYTHNAFTHKTARVLFTLFAVCSVLLGIWGVVIANAPQSPYGEEIEGNPRIDTRPIMEDDLDRYINRLADVYECPDCPETYRRIDDNGRYSYSCLQFQEATFVQEAKRFKFFPYAEDLEIPNFIYDCQVQKQLARAMFLTDPYASFHWKTSVLRGLGVAPSPAITQIVPRRNDPEP